MLERVMRHGFEFWEAPRNNGPVFEDVDPECQYRAELMRLRRKRFELLSQIVRLVTFGDEAVEGGRLSSSQVGNVSSPSPLTSDSSPTEGRGGPGALGTASPYPSEGLNAKSAKTAKRYAKKKEDPYDRAVWGDLADLSDEEPVGVLVAMGIPRDEETLTRRGETEPDIAAIQDRVMRMFGLTQQEFFEPNKRRDVALARAVSMALCRAHTNRTQEEIARAHDRNVAAVCRAVTRVEKLREADAGLAAKIAVIEAAIVPRAMAA